jgi:hypothetical protein
MNRGEHMNAVEFSDAEEKHFPSHWDDETKQLVRFMLMEAFNNGSNQGFEIGRNQGFEVSTNLLNDVINRLTKKKNRQNEKDKTCNDL